MLQQFQGFGEFVAFFWLGSESSEMQSFGHAPLVERQSAMNGKTQQQSQYPAFVWRFDHDDGYFRIEDQTEVLGLRHAFSLR